MVLQRSSQSLAFKEVYLAAPFICGVQRMIPRKINMLSPRPRNSWKQRQTWEQTESRGLAVDSYVAITGNAALESAFYHLHLNHFHFWVGPSPFISDLWIENP